MRLISPSTIKGTVKAPPSKSMTGRALAASLLALGVSEIDRPSACDDSLAIAGIIEALGARVERKSDALFVNGVGRSGLDCKGVLDCRESGLAMRMFAPIAALAARKTTLTASGSLWSRPMGMIDALARFSALGTTKNGFPPVVVEGPMRGGTALIDASLSSQFLSGLLMALPLCEGPSILAVSGLQSAPYVRTTVDLLGRFGISIGHDRELKTFSIEGGQTYRPCRLRVEGDWSGASFLLVAGAIAGSVTVEGLDCASVQADRAILDALSDAGARVETRMLSVRVEARDLRPFVFDAASCPDLFPPLVALASCCRGKSVIHGVGRLTHKESDRAAALCVEFGRLGVDVRIDRDAMQVRGGRLSGASVDSHNDHRIAMACAVAALRANESVAISGSACVSKSYPAFFADLSALGAGT